MTLMTSYWLPNASVTHAQVQLSGNTYPYTGPGQPLLPPGFEAVALTVCSPFVRPDVLVGRLLDPEVYYWGCVDHPEMQYTSRGYQGVYGDGSRGHQAAHSYNCPVCGVVMPPISASKFKCLWWDHPAYKKFSMSVSKWLEEFRASSPHGERPTIPWARLYRP